MCTATDSLADAYQACLDRLIDAGILLSLGVPGVYGFAGVFEDVIDHFERLVTRHGAALEPEVLRFPAIMSRRHYLQTSHIDNFPDLMGSVHSFTGDERAHLRMLQKRASGDDWTRDLTPAEVMLTPAACYPLYPTATGTVPSKGRLVDLRSFVFRHEPSNDPARMQIFRQREFVRIGTAEQALAHREDWLKKGEEILASVGLEVRVEPASDPFFGRAGKVMASAQMEQALKFELLHAVATEEKPTAITSCNYHLDYFGRAFDIRTPDGQPAHTACIGFGLERIALALFMKHGFDVDEWPAEIRTVLGL
jgi:seryl-tRNA synthetase